MLKTVLRTVAAALLVVVVATPAMARDSVQPLLERMVQSYLKLDADGLEALWAREGRLVFAGGEINGAQMIGERYRMVFSQLGEGLHLEVSVTEEWAHDNVIVAWGTFAQRDDGELVDDGRFVMRVIKEGDEWKLYRVWILHAAS